MSGPLEGIAVIDCGAWIQELMAAAFLGDLGADVIKVEARGTGNPMRGIITATYQTERPAHFEAINRSKRGTPCTTGMNALSESGCICSCSRLRSTGLHSAKQRG